MLLERACLGLLPLLKILKLQWALLLLAAGLDKTLLVGVASASLRVVVSVVLLVLFCEVKTLHFLLVVIRVILIMDTVVRIMMTVVGAKAIGLALGNDFGLANSLLGDLGRASLALLLNELLLATWNLVDILEMSSQVSTLCESFVAEGAREWSLTGVLSEVIPQVATLFENTVAPRILALEEKLHSLRVRVLHLDSLVPLLGNARESVGLEVLLVLGDLGSHGVVIVRNSLVIHV